MYPITLDLDNQNLKKFIESNKIKVILFAETHGFLDELPIQDKIISEVSPKFYLYEMLEEEELINKEKQLSFLSEKDEKDFSIISKFGELKKVIRLALKYNLKLVGCDIKNMCRKDKDFLKQKTLTSEEIKEEEILRKRELHQKEIIEKCSIKSDKPVFVSLGAYHLRKDSPLMLLDNFIIIVPLFDGEQIFGEEGIENKKVSYLITSKKQYLNKNG